MARKKTVWGQPGETGFTRDGIPWYVPEGGPPKVERFFEWLLPSAGTASMPPGARLVKARTSAEAQERLTRKFGEDIAGLLDEGERLIGFTEFHLDENVPQPPRVGIEAKIGPSRLKHWWMGGDWNTTAGQLITRIGGSRGHTGILTRNELLIRTDRRVMIWRGDINKPMWVDGEYDLDQIGIRPEWMPVNRAADDNGFRVDIAFPDSSWIGVHGTTGRVPGGRDYPADRDLLAELVGPPVAAYSLPALGRQ